MTNPQPTIRNPYTDIVAVIAGSSVGALAIALSHELPNSYSDLLLYLSPSIAILAAIIAQKTIDYVGKKSRRKKIEADILLALKFIDESLKDGNLTKQRKVELKDLYQRINELRTKSIFKRLENKELEEEFARIYDELRTVLEKTPNNNPNKNITKDYLRHLIGEADCEKVLELLKKKIKDKTDADMLIKISAQFHQIEKDYAASAIDEDEKANRLQKVNAGLLGLIDDLEE